MPQVRREFAHIIVERPRTTKTKDGVFLCSSSVGPNVVVEVEEDASVSEVML